MWRQDCGELYTVFDPSLSVYYKKSEIMSLTDRSIPQVEHIWGSPK